jgi:hypothetical protein
MCLLCNTGEVFLMRALTETTAWPTATVGEIPKPYPGAAHRKAPKFLLFIIALHAA